MGTVHAQVSGGRTKVATQPCQLTCCGAELPVASGMGCCQTPRTARLKCEHRLLRCWTTVVAADKGVIRALNPACHIHASQATLCLCPLCNRQHGAVQDRRNPPHLGRHQGSYCWQLLAHTAAHCWLRASWCRHRQSYGWQGLGLVCAKLALPICRSRHCIRQSVSCAGVPKMCMCLLCQSHSEQAVLQQSLGS